MPSPIWTTDVTDLGAIQKQAYFEFQLEAIDAPNTITYELIAGKLPDGLRLTSAGLIKGVPEPQFAVTGVALQSEQAIKSTFCVRATSSDIGIADMSFSLTVIGETPPVIVTQAAELARVLDSTYINIPIVAIDLDNEPIEWNIISGSLPPGITLNKTTGVISGYVRPAYNADTGAIPGWSSETPWDQDVWDFYEFALSKSYEFQVSVTDGKKTVAKQYSIFVYTHNALSAENEAITVDEAITSDQTIFRTPVLLTAAGDLGIVEQDNYFAYEFKSLDFDGDLVNYTILVAENIGFDNETYGFDSTLLDAGDLGLPPGLKLDTSTGWLYGYIPKQNATQIEYSFGVRVYKENNPTYISPITYFTITVVGDLRNVVVWNSPTDLGSVNTGQVCELSISATTANNKRLYYTLKNDEGSLPQALKLLNDGTITGRTSFQYIGFDKDTTTFDFTAPGVQTPHPTSFDRVHHFTIRAADSEENIIAYKQFTITVNSTGYAPYENLYIEANPGKDGKDLFFSVVNNSDNIPTEALYRPTDPNFGRAKHIRLLALGGIAASTAQQYVDAMQLNHYRKQLTFNDIRTAQSLDINGNVKYEVVYVHMRDPLDNVGRNVASAIGVLHPNSLINMRNQIVAELEFRGREEVLPDWMYSKQPTGQILGWQPAVVLCYVKPGYGARVAFNLRRQNAELKNISFDFDRYIWNDSLSLYYDASEGDYVDGEMTTFDRTLGQVGTLAATVDFAVELAFDQIDGASQEIVEALGGFDGLIRSYNGMRIIFAKQEFSDAPLNNGFVINDVEWSDGVTWDDPDYGFDEYHAVLGYEEHQNNPAAVNQQAGVWEVTTVDGVFRLQFITKVDPGQLVAVRSGTKYGGYTVVYGPNIIFAEGFTVPYYTKANPITSVPGTTFDNSNTEFVEGQVVYNEPDVNDTYLPFPKKIITG
jgi:hypothetical protein